jgi:hypothetical protein
MVISPLGAMEVYHAVYHVVPGRSVPLAVGWWWRSRPGRTAWRSWSPTARHRRPASWLSSSVGASRWWIASTPPARRWSSRRRAGHCRPRTTPATNIAGHGPCFPTLLHGIRPRPKTTTVGKARPNASTDTATMTTGSRTSWSPVPSVDAGITLPPAAILPHAATPPDA